MIKYKLQAIGLNDNQCDEVFLIMNQMPIHILEGVNNVYAHIENGIIIIEPNNESKYNLTYLDTFALGS